MPKKISSGLKMLKEPKGIHETMEHLFWRLNCFGSMAHVLEKGLFQAESGGSSGGGGIYFL